MIEQQLLDILACPKCKGVLASVENGRGLVCEHCKLRYPVRDLIPVMLVEEALDLKSGERLAQGAAVRLARVSFRVIDGPDNNMTFQLEQGTCRAIGRGGADPNKTSVFNVDLALALDESTRSLVIQYIGRQFHKGGQSASQAGDRLGQFRRAPDIVLTDTSLSRLHAMIFSDESGVGVLDLVSKNGTFVNGQEVESKPLKRGDKIELGETTIQYEG